LSRYRIYYEKEDGVRFISHLDFMRTAMRAFRRAGLPVHYSKGFNPHTIMTVALPVPVGMTSRCESMEVELDDGLSGEEITAKLSAVMPDGLPVRGAENAEGLQPFKHIASAQYRVTFLSGAAPDATKLLAQDEIVLEKRTKRGLKDTDVKEDIFDITPTEGGLVMCLAAGSTRNLKPELVLAAFTKYQGITFDEVRICREEIFMEDGSALTNRKDGLA